MKRRGRKSAKSIWKGKRGEKAFCLHLEEFSQSNVEIWNNPLNFEGVDIVVKDKDGKPIQVYEVTNYAKTSFMSRTRAKRYIDSLNFWKFLYPEIYRALVVSYPSTVDKVKGVRKMFKDEETTRSLLFFSKFPLLFCIS